MKNSKNWLLAAVVSGSLLAPIGGDASAGLVTLDFEDQVLGSSFPGVPGRFTASTEFGAALQIDPKVGVFTPSLPGLGNHTLSPALVGGASPRLPDFRIQFVGLIDFFEVYVLDAEEAFQLTTDTGLVGIITDFGDGPGGPVRKVQIGAIGGPDQFQTVFFDDQNFPAELGGSGPGPWDLLTFNVVPEPSTLAIIGLGIAGLGLVRRRAEV